MSIIPLDLQRRFEQRWAARFAPPAASTAPGSINSKQPVHKLPRIAKGKTRRVQLARISEPANTSSHSRPSCQIKTIGILPALTTPR
jgi:hypothetical protein